MPFCGKCGTEVESTERFCAKCGSPQEIIVLQKRQREAPRSRKSSAPILSLLLIIILTVGSIAAFFILPDNNHIIYDLFKTSDEQITSEQELVSEEDLSIIPDNNRYENNSPEGDENSFNGDLEQVCRGNTIGNIVNVGFAAQYENLIFHRGNPNGGGIYKTNTLNGEHLLITSDDAWNINVCDTWVYYSNRAENWNVFKIRHDGSERTQINRDDSGNLQLVGHWLYYRNDDDNGSIYKIRTDGSDRTLINQDQSYFINVIGEWIYFQNRSDGGKIYRISLDGNEQKQINDDDSWNINVVDDWIFYSTPNEGWNICKISLDGTERIVINQDDSGNINVAGDFIYYRNDDDNGRLYRIRTDGTEKLRINNDQSFLFSILDDWIYYQNRSDDKRIYRIRTDGSERQKVEGLEQAPSIETYTVVGLLPLTGALGTYGENSLEAARLATADVNKWLIEEGRAWRLNLEFDDTQGEGPVGFRKMQIWYGEGVEFFVGPMASNVIRECLSFVNANEFLIISPLSTDPDLAIEGDWLFRFCYDETLDSTQPPSLGDKSYRGHVRNHIINKLGRETKEEFAFNTYDIIWAIALSIDSVGYSPQLVKIILPDIVREWSSVYGASGMVLLNKAGDRVSP